MIERKKIFISHANPDDNLISDWIYKKLLLFGYEPWCDIHNLLGGEKDFWGEIQNVIRDESIKFILVFSKYYHQKDGTMNEYEYAISIEKEYKLKDYIIPIRIDNVAYNEIIGLNRRNIIDFQSWGEGLKKIIKKLERDEIKHTKIDNYLDNWLNSKYTTQNGMYPQMCNYYSNWLKIDNIPEFLFCFEFQNETLADAILSLNNNLMIIKHGTYLVSFEEKLEFLKSVDNMNIEYEIKPKNIIKVSTKALIHKGSTKNFPTNSDISNLIIELISKAFHQYLESISLSVYELSNNRKCYYYKKESVHKKVDYFFNSKNKLKSLTGKYFEDIWHYGFSFKVLKFPYLHFSCNCHLLFSSNGLDIWNDKDKLHSARRKKGKNFFNAEWRDLLIAFLTSIKNEENSIKFKITEHISISVPYIPEIFQCKFDYFEPSDDSRFDVIEDYISDNEEITDLNDYE
jgi:hypothetical protein